MGLKFTQDPITKRWIGYRSGETPKFAEPAKKPRAPKAEAAATAEDAGAVIGDEAILEDKPKRKRTR